MNRLLAILAAACVGVAVLAGGGCGSSDSGAAAKNAGKKDEHAKEGEHKEGIIKLAEEEVARAGVRTVAAQEQEFADTVTLTATVQANRERIAHVTPRVPGRVTSVAAKLGDTVKRGQTLAILESIEVGEAYSAYAQALAEANVARTAFERAERLHAEQIIPGKEHQRARGEYEKTRAQVQAASGKLKMLGISPSAGVKGAAVSAFPLTAPLGGTVIERKAVLGELAKTEESLFVVADLSNVWLEANVGEADLGRVRNGAQARVRVAAMPDEVFEGKVNHVGAVMDKDTRTVKATIELPNPKGLLRPQMFASVAIEIGTSRKVLALPESAVTLVQGLPTVFVEESAGFEARPVEIAERSAGKVIVKSGVQSGDLVVTEGVYALKARLLKSQIGSGHAH